MASMVRDIDPSGSSSPQYLTPFGGGLAFSARDDGHGRELWFSDGDSAHRLRDIRPGTAGSDPRQLTVVGDTLFFSANDGARGRELWRTRGTAASTRRVRDIHPGLASSSPDFLTAFKGKVFFAAGDGTHGRELWKSDGTSAGTVMVKDIQAHGSSLYRSGFTLPTPWVVFKDRLYFGVQFDHLGLWRTDGTRAGTKLVIEGVYPQNLLATSVRLYFVGLSGGCAVSEDIYSSDGVSPNPTLVTSYYQDLPIVTFQGRAYYHHGEDTSRRLYRTAGTASSTGPLLPKVALDDGSPLLATGGALFLSQHGGLSISDGTGTGTHALRDAESGFIARVDVVRLNGLWYFPGGFGDAASDLWRTDGTSDGTSMASPVDLDFQHDLRSLVKSGGAVWFTANDSIHGRELWRFEP